MIRHIYVEHIKLTSNLHDNSQPVASIAFTFLERAIQTRAGFVFFIRFLF